MLHSAVDWNFGLAWIAFAFAVALHVADEARHDFLATYNPNALAIRRRLHIPFPPVFTLRTLPYASLKRRLPAAPAFPVCAARRPLDPHRCCAAWHRHWDWQRVPTHWRIPALPPPDGRDFQFARPAGSRGMACLERLLPAARAVLARPAAGTRRVQFHFPSHCRGKSARHSGSMRTVSSSTSSPLRMRRNCS